MATTCRLERSDRLPTRDLIAPPTRLLTARTVAVASLLRGPPAVIVPPEAGGANVAGMMDPM